MERNFCPHPHPPHIPLSFLIGLFSEQARLCIGFVHIMFVFIDFENYKSLENCVVLIALYFKIVKFLMLLINSLIMQKVLNV